MNMETNEFRREPRYIVFKLKDVDRHLTSEQRRTLQLIGENIAAGRDEDGKPPFNAAVVEQDWPEFDVVWEMIEARMTGKPQAGSVKLPTNADEAALMALVGTNWLAEHAPERLKQAEATELAALVEAKDKVMRKVREELRACQAVIHLSGGFDPAYVRDAQAAMKEADDVLSLTGPDALAAHDADLIERLATAGEEMGDSAWSTGEAKFGFAFAKTLRALAAELEGK